MLEQKVNTDRSNLHVAIFLRLQDALDVRLEDAEGAELCALAQDSLNRRYSPQLLDRELVNRLNVLVFGNIRKAILAVLAKTAVLTEDARVDQALEDAVGKACVAHVEEAG